MTRKHLAAPLLLLIASCAAAASGCLPGGNGYLRARVGGALDLDIDWRNAELECEGSPRPDGSGIRVSFAGPLRSDGRRMRMVFGIGAATEGRSGRSLPTNLTVLLEGEQRLFTTRGGDRCTVDELDQERIGALGGPTRSYKVIARGFCFAPATALKGDERIVVSRFDFAGRTTFEDDVADLSTFPRATLEIKSGNARHQFNIWLAQTPEQQMQGLMYVSDLPADEGMLFVQSKPRDGHVDEEHFHSARYAVHRREGTRDEDRGKCRAAFAGDDQLGRPGQRRARAEGGGGGAAGDSRRR